MKPFIWMVCLLYQFGAFAQDTLWTIEIDSVLVSDSRLQYESIGAQIYTIQSLDIGNQSVGDALQAQTPIFLKQYGPGMLQSASARGTGAGHLGVNWNGVNIQSVSLGQVDFGLISPSETISYIPSSNSTIDGSGNLGGLVRLDTKFNHQGFQLEFGSGIGQFHHTRHHGLLRLRKKKWAMLSDFSFKKGKNDFSYVNTSSVNQPVSTQINNAYHATHFRQSHEFTLSNQHLLRIHYWMTVSKREIPPTMIAANDHAQQDDQAHRFVLDWIFGASPSITLKTKIALLNEQMTYQNDGLFAFTATSKQIIDSRLLFKKGLHRIQLGTLGSYEKAYSDGYDSQPSRVTTALSVADNLVYGNFSVSLQTRIEGNDWQQFIPVFSIAQEWAFLPKWIQKTKFGRHFRAPTFNDLFWANLGNPSLKDEVGYQAEASLIHQGLAQNQHWTGSITTFWLLVNDWILWAPDQNGIWRPNNSKQVQSTGIESKMTYTFSRKPFLANLSLGHTFVKSINKDTYNQTHIGKQLIYIPKHKANGQIQLQYHQTKLTYQNTFVGKRALDASNLHTLPFYINQSIRLQQILSIKKTQFDFSLGILNLSNKNYQIIQYRPMPGRSWDLGFIVHFNSQP